MLMCILNGGAGIPLLHMLYRPMIFSMSAEVLVRRVVHFGFLQAVKTHARFKPASRDQSYKASLRPYAAVATAILSCALVSISLLQQQLSHSWDCTIPV